MFAAAAALPGQLPLSQKREFKFAAFAEFGSSRYAESQEDSESWIWNVIYKPRIGHLAGINQTVPCMFPGSSPALSTPSASHNFAFDRAQAIARNQFFANRRIFERSTIGIHKDSWRWRYIKRSRFKELSLKPEALSIKEQDLLPLLEAVEDLSSLRTLFNFIHRSWSNVEPIDYSDAALKFALAALNETSKCTLRLAFELEEYGSYCALRSKHLILHTVLYEGKWIDIGFRKPDEIRASERCIAYRILLELEKLALGKTAPLLVNEFDCAADGNHRLTAAWVWNALHNLRAEVWEPGNAKFEMELVRFFTTAASVKSKLAVANALEALSILLSESESRQKIIGLKDTIASRSIEKLPVVPLLSYSGLAIDRLAYECDGQLRRFNPAHYQTLQAEPSTCLQEKACYHMTDFLPLPLFNVLEGEYQELRKHK